jgi:hypothetical protein
MTVCTLHVYASSTSKLEVVLVLVLETALVAVDDGAVRRHTLSACTASVMRLYDAV